MIMKQSDIFSLHACCFCLSWRPPRELNRNDGAQKVITREKVFQGSKFPPNIESSVETGVLLIRGTGATLRSGRVKVFALRIVVAEASGALVVGTGTSECSNLRGGGMTRNWSKRQITESNVLAGQSGPTGVGQVGQEGTNGRQCHQQKGRR
jgi:hypothetical protein